jgi:hypothetical protein
VVSRKNAAPEMQSSAAGSTDFFDKLLRTADFPDSVKRPRKQWNYDNQKKQYSLRPFLFEKIRKGCGAYHKD